MAEDVAESADANGIEDYHLHVSQRYLALTQEKLRYARLPRQLPTSPQNDAAGLVAKAELDPLLDFWLESYDFRAQENIYNNSLPQYRINIDVSPPLGIGDTTNSLRVHYVHRRSSHDDAIPLLVCYDWGSSFIEIARMIDALCEPVTTPPIGNPEIPAFHVVCPSIPGFGFSDVSEDGDFGLQATADIFQSLMQKLSYREYVALGSGWGFKICRALVCKYPGSCMALYTTNPEVPNPRLRSSPLAWLKYRIAWLTRGKIAQLCFGYVSDDLVESSASVSAPQNASLSWLDDAETLSYTLADSPTGLLVFLLKLICPQHPRGSAGTHLVRASSASRPWTYSDTLTWTMLYWLPGPEAPLRWLRNAARETGEGSGFWHSYSPVPLGISYFKPTAGTISAPPVWASAYHDLVWLTRHGRPAKWPAWEAPDEMVLDLRAFVGGLRNSGRLGFRFVELD